MKTEIIKNMFACPNCGEKMTFTADGKSIICRGFKRHCWDLSSSGYVNFAGSGGGDSAEAVAARRRFLALGKYAPAAELIVKLVAEYSSDGAVVDAGCGEGYYSKAIADSGHDVCGFDLSRRAVEAASKLRVPNTAFAVAGINKMPLKDSTCGCITNIFAPCFEDEFARVLKPGGVLILAGAGEAHLLSLKRALYENAVLNTERADLPTKMRLIEQKRLKYEFELSENREIYDLFAMTPYYYRTGREAAAKLEGLSSLTVDADFDIRVYKVCKD